MNVAAIGRGIASAAASAWARQVAALALYMVAARALAPEAVGLFALAAAIALLFEYAVFDSISESVVQRHDFDPRHLGAALGLGALLAVAIALGGLLAAAPIEAAFALPGFAGPFAAMTCGVALVCLSAAHAGALRREGRFHAIASLAAAAGVISAGLGAALLLAGYGIAAMVTYFVAEKVLLCLGTIWLARRRPLARFSAAQLRDLAPYAAAIGGQRMAFYARSQTDRLIIAAIWGPAVLGAYQIAARIFDSLQAILLAPASKLFFVGYARTQRDPERLGEMFATSVQAIALVAFPAFLGVSAVAPEAVRLLFGDQWGSSARILEILAFGGVALVLSVTAGSVLSAVGRARDYLAVEVAAALAGLGLLLALAPFGVAWMAAAFVLREAFAVALYARLLRRGLDLRLRVFVGWFAPCLGAALAMWAALRLLGAELPADLPLAAALALKIAAGAAVYAACVLLFCRPALRRAARVFAAPRPQEGAA